MGKAYQRFVAWQVVNMFSLAALIFCIIQLESDGQVLA